jgi:hypothetical protein
MILAPQPDELPFVYERDDSKRRIHVVAKRSLGVLDFAEMLRRQVDERTWSYGVVYDLRRQTVPISVADRQRLHDGILNALGVHGPRGPVALVAWTPDVLQSMEDYAAVANPAGFRVGVFMRVLDAQQWLDDEQHALPQDSTPQNRLYPDSRPDYSRKVE